MPHLYPSSSSRAAGEALASEEQKRDLPNLSIAARLCQISEVDQADALSFLEEHHRQKTVQVNALSLGLFHDGKLLGVAQFCAPRTAAKRRRYTTELLRMCFKAGVRVPGGASKLIAHYKRTYHPADIFTYQDATGELTDVYEHCGFTLVSQAKKKEYLVAPGKTLADAARSEYFTMGEAVRRGPDALLGVKLGERHHSDGRRKTNPELFIEELGWHVEETPGDRVYEWVDPNRTYYTYRITSTDSDKYYFGVSHVKRPNATVEDCLNDGYWGSGGTNPNNKFANWKRKHRSSLRKEIVALYARKGPAYEAERQLVAEQWKSDPYCLNSKPGGLGAYSPTTAVTMNTCPVHGLTTFRGGTCLRCAFAEVAKVADCPIHGKTKHQGEFCVRCLRQKGVSLKPCSIHGVTKHQGEVCGRCKAERTFAKKKCPVHGVTNFAGESCRKCSKATALSAGECPVHGVVLHHGGSCLTCVAQNKVVVRECPVHGRSKFTGETCYSCVRERTVSKQNCPVHGLTSHEGDTCSKCRAASQYRLAHCPVHGESKHQGGVCKKCQLTKNVQVKNCPVHGPTKHNGDKCYRCRTRKTTNKSEIL